LQPAPFWGKFSLWRIVIAENPVFRERRNITPFNTSVHSGIWKDVARSLVSWHGVCNRQQVSRVFASLVFPQTPIVESGVTPPVVGRRSWRQVYPKFGRDTLSVTILLEITTPPAFLGGPFYNNPIVSPVSEPRLLFSDRHHGRSKCIRIYSNSVPSPFIHDYGVLHEEVDNEGYAGTSPPLR
jgi:hypothetical protein